MPVVKYIIPFITICGFLYGCSGNEQRENTNNIAVNDSIALPDTGWVTLFDGQTLTGWHSYGTSEPGTAWKVDSGAIHLSAAAKKGYQTLGGGDLVSDGVYENFRFEIEWKVSRAANSGILLFVQEDTMMYKETWNTGFELQVCDKDFNVDAHVFKRDAGDIYDLVPASTQAAKGYDQWNKVELICNKGKVDVSLNGIQNLSFTVWDDKWRELIAGSKFKDMAGFGSFRSGKIALQDHGQDVWYKNIRIKRL